MTNLQVIEGIRPAYEEKLKATDITNVAVLLKVKERKREEIIWRKCLIFLRNFFHI